MPLAQMPDLVPVLPELFLALVIMALLMFGVFQKGGRAHLQPPTNRRQPHSQAPARGRSAPHQN